ncbi:MAG: hypothetical protein HY303_12985, partial [Candidatus Wallbacteria bacterium]|nr:hypothetical protein [Candidatus Wallbacteria bacterium]
MKRRAAALTVACAVLVLMGARQSWAGEAPGVRLRMAQHYELIEGELDRALAIYVELENSPGAIGQQATVGLARTLQKLGRGQEARRRLATIEESSLKGSLRAQVLALRGFLGAAATESKPGAAGLVSVRVKRAPGMPGQGAESSTVTLNFADAKLGDVVSQVARGANLDVVVSPSMSGRRITARLSRAEPVGALRVLAHAAGAELGEWAGTITLAAPDEIGRMVLGRSSAGSPPSTATVVLVAARIYAPARGDAPRKLLSKPSVAVRDGELARIQVRSSHAKTSGAGRVPVDEDQFDLDLQVKPTVGLDSDDVKLDV